MNRKMKSCFVIMPFLPELHYFYLYLKAHVESKHGISCKRGDADKLTVPLLDKIRSYIDEADVLIADCSNRNPNVFYELGMAHTLGKKVILITKDLIEEAPVDIRHFEFIKYELHRHLEFLDSLDNALRRVFIDRYDDLFKMAETTFDTFIKDTSARISMATKESFTNRIIAAEQVGNIPNIEDELAIKQFVLPRIIQDSSDFSAMKLVTGWLTNIVTESK